MRNWCKYHRYAINFVTTASSAQFIFNHIWSSDRHPHHSDMVPKLMQDGAARDRHASPASGSLNSTTRLSAARQRQMNTPYTDGAKQMENSAELDELDVRDSTKTKGEMPIKASDRYSCRDLQSAAEGQVYICSCLLCVLFAANLRCWAVRSSSTLQASSCLQDHSRISK